MRLLTITGLLFFTACSGKTADVPPVDGSLPNIGWPDLDGGVRFDLAATGPRTDGAVDNSQLVVERPYTLQVPTGYRPGVPAPLLILLHGYGVNGWTQNVYFGLGDIVDQKGFLYAYPDGTSDPTGQHFWNATDACCNFFGSTVDDVAYVNAIIDDVEKKYDVDRKRIFLVGHSNGAFMSYRLACDLSPRIAAIVGLAGAIWQDAARCQPSEPVSVLAVHGTLDVVVVYNGGQIFGNTYPGARETVSRWAGMNG